jgi:hypothetical protein
MKVSPASKIRGIHLQNVYWQRDVEIISLYSSLLSEAIAKFLFGIS